MIDRYDPQEIEARWQAVWEKDRAFATGKGREKYYVLEMFPYPSGKIHMGHVRNYSIGDVLARFLMMKGKDVLHPMGWDSFGLPAENAAIQNNIQPAKWTHENIDNMKKQLRRMGLSYDWDREVATCTPEYYKWNQWIFLKFLEKGLAYKKRSAVNWCPGCSTVLANEQVEDGVCWRCDSVVETKDLEQWFFKITEYAEELLEHTDKLPGWPERVLTMQRNWIGRSVGAEVSFKIEGSGGVIEIFTTRPDTLYGVTFMSLAAGHPAIERITTPERRAEVEKFTARLKAEAITARNVDEVAKEGVFTGAYCINPLTGGRVPVYVANFVLMGYGTGAVMAVPAHDQRDFEFAKVYGLPVKVVINPPDSTLDPETMEGAYVDEGVMADSAPFDGMKNTEAMEGIIDLLEEKKAGKRAINYRLRDWGISRQRYWGCPIPVIYCDECGTVPVPIEELPVVLPEDVRLTGTGASPLATAEGFVNAKCPKCGHTAWRETDTMDTFVDSSWYFLRYVSPKEEAFPFRKGDAEYWMPVDQYIGGIEHAVMHLLYARFFTKALRDLGLHNFDEPFKNLLTQGMVRKEIVRCPEHGFLAPDEARDGKCARCGSVVEIGPVEKMSKSKKNTIDPDMLIAEYGADTTRLFSLFAAPPDKDLDWNEDGVEGSFRFLGRVWRMVVENLEILKAATPYRAAADGPLTGANREMHFVTHRTIKKVTEDIEKRFHFNTAISSIMELVNAIYQFKQNPVGCHCEPHHPSPPGSRIGCDAIMNCSVGEGFLGRKVAHKCVPYQGMPRKMMVCENYKECRLVARMLGEPMPNDVRPGSVEAQVMLEAVEAVVLLLSPFAPHVSEELWAALGATVPVYRTPWPEVSEDALVRDEVSLVVQVNGKVRSKVAVPVDSAEDTVKEAVMNDEKTQEWIQGKTLRKFVYVPNKIVNVVVS